MPNTIDKVLTHLRLFLRDYTAEITLITLGEESKWTKKELKLIQEAQVTVISTPLKTIELKLNCTNITFADQKTMTFDCIYSALGNIKNNRLASDLKLHLTGGSITVDKDQQTSVQGVYAAGDIVSGLNQICVASSQAALAATAIHKSCRKYIQ